MSETPQSQVSADEVRRYMPDALFASKPDARSQNDHEPGESENVQERPE